MPDESQPPRTFKTNRSLCLHFRITLKRRRLTIKDFCRKYNLDYKYFSKALFYEFKCSKRLKNIVYQFVVKFEHLRPVPKRR